MLVISITVLRDGTHKSGSRHEFGVVGV